MAKKHQRFIPNILTLTNMFLGGSSDLRARIYHRLWRLRQKCLFGSGGCPSANVGTLSGAVLESQGGFSVPSGALWRFLAASRRRSERCWATDFEDARRLVKKQCFLLHVARFQGRRAASGGTPWRLPRPLRTKKRGRGGVQRARRKLFRGFSSEAALQRAVAP